MSGSAGHGQFRLQVGEYPISDIIVGGQTALDGTRLTVNATDLPSGDSWGSLMRWSFIIAWTSNGSFAADRAAA